MLPLWLLGLGLPLAMTPAAHAQSAAPAANTPRPALLRLAAGASYLYGASSTYWVPRISLEYAPQLGQHWRLASRLAYAKRTTDYPIFVDHSIPLSYRVVNLEQEVYWLPFGASRRVEFGVGGGGFVGNYRQVGWLQAALLPNKQFSYEAWEAHGFRVGYMFSLALDVALSSARTWRLGGRASLQHTDRAHELTGGQLVLSRAL